MRISNDMVDVRIREWERIAKGGIGRSSDMDCFYAFLDLRDARAELRKWDGHNVEQIVRLLDERLKLGRALAAANEQITGLVADRDRLELELEKFST